MCIAARFLHLLSFGDAGGALPGALKKQRKRLWTKCFASNSRSLDRYDGFPLEPVRLRTVAFLSFSLSLSLSKPIEQIPFPI